MRLEESAYYDGTRLHSMGTPITMACGSRSMGKTYYEKRLAIRKYIQTGEHWMYMRRYDDQLKQMLRKGTFFSDVMGDNWFPGWEVRVNGRIMEAKREGEKSFHLMGEFLALNSYEARKGDMDRQLTRIVFDEFIKSKKRSQYLPDEVDAFSGMWETYDRKENRVRVHMCANGLDAVNPYFLQWGITVTENMPEFTRWHGGTVALQVTRGSAAFQESAEGSWITQVTKGSRYDDLNRGNSFGNLSDDFVVKKLPTSAQCLFAIVWQNQAYTVWLDRNAGEYYVRKANKPQNCIIYALTRQDMRPNLVMIDRASKLLQTLSRYYRYGYCFFDSVRTRERFLDMLQLVGKL